MKQPNKNKSNIVKIGNSSLLSQGEGFILEEAINAFKSTPLPRINPNAYLQPELSEDERRLQSENPFVRAMGSMAQPGVSEGFSEAKRLGAPQIINNPIDRTLLAEYQGGGEEFINSVAGFGKQAIAGFIDSAAAWDVTDIYNMASGDMEHKYGNWLNESGLAKWAKDMTGLEIYSPQGESMFDSTYWANMFQSQGYTAGIIAETLAEQLLIASLTGGSGNIASALRMGSKANLIKQGLFGSVKGVQEAYINALETGDAIEQELRQRGITDEQKIIELKAEASVKGFRAEVGPLMALNALQFASVFGRTPQVFSKGAGKEVGIDLGYSSLGQGVFGQAFKGVKNKYAKGGIDFLGQGLSEGLEEVVQGSISKYAVNSTLKENDSQKYDTFSTYDYLQDESYIFNEDNLHNFVAGTFGGFMFEGAGRLYNTTVKTLTGKNAITKAQEKFISSHKARTTEAFLNYRKAEQEIHKLKAQYKKSNYQDKDILTSLQEKSQELESLKNNLDLQNTVAALELDYLKGSTAAFESQIEWFETLDKAVKEKDIDTLKQYGVLDKKGREVSKGALENIQNTFQDKIKDAYAIKESLENNLLNVTSDFESAVKITNEEFQKSKLISSVGELNKHVNTLYSNTAFSDFSSQGLERFKLEQELLALERVEKRGLLTELNKERIKEIKEILKNTEQYSSTDKKNIERIPMSIREGILSGHEASFIREKDINKRQENIKEFSDTKEIEKNVRKRRKEALKKAKSKEEVDEITQEAKKDGTLTPETAKDIKEKKIQLEAEKIVNSKKDIIKDETPLSNKENSILNKGISESSTKEERYAEIDRQVAEGILDEETAQAFKDQIANSDVDISNFSRYSDSLEQELDSYIKEELNPELNREATFEDLIRKFLSKTTKENVDKAFNNFKNAWINTGRNLEENEAENIYKKYFDRAESLVEGFLKLSEEDMADMAKKSSEEVSSKTNKAKNYKPTTNVAQTSTSNKDGRLATPDLKASHKHIDSERVNGEWKTLSLGLLPIDENSAVDNRYILDTEFMSILENEQNSLVASLMDFDEQPFGKNKTWGQVKEEKRKQLTEEAYQRWFDATVPVVVKTSRDINYKGKVIPAGTAISFISSESWYNTNNVREEVLQEGKENVKIIRQQVKEGNVILNISSRGFGSIQKTSDIGPTQPLLTLNEAMPHAIIGQIHFEGDKMVVVTNRSNNEVSKVKIINDSINEKTFKNDTSIVTLVPAYTNSEGEMMYYVYPTNTKGPDLYGNLKGDIEPSIYNTMKYGILAHIIENNKTDSELLKYIQETYGFTLEDANRINTYYSKKSASPTNELVEFLKLFTRNGYSILNTINSKDMSIEQKLDILLNETTGTLKKQQFNVSMTALNRDTFGLLDENGQITEEKPYTEHVKDNLYTNIVTHEVEGPAGNTVRVLDVQPMVFYSTEVNSTVKENIERQNKEEQEAIERINSELKSQIDILENSGLSQEQIELAKTVLLNNIQELSSRYNLTQEQQEEIDNYQTNLISTLTSIEQSLLVDSLLNTILSSITEDTSLLDIKEISINSIDALLDSKIKDLENILEVLKNIPDTETMSLTYRNHINKLQGIKNEKEKLLNTDIKQGPIGDLIKILNRTFNTDFDTVELTEEFSEEENFSKSFLEKPVTMSFSTKLKIFLHGIQKKNVNNNPMLNSLGLPQYEDSSNILNSILEITTEIPSDLETLDSHLTDAFKKTGQYKYEDIRNKIKNASKQLQNELLHKTISKKLTLYKILLTAGKPVEITLPDGSKEKISTDFTIGLLDENSDKEVIKWKNTLVENFLSSNFVTTDRKINIEYAKNLLKEIDKLVAEKSIDKKKIKDFFKKANLDMFTSNAIDKYIDFEGKSMYDKYAIMDYLQNKIKYMVENPNMDIEANNPFKNSVFKGLINTEILINGSSVASSIRVGGKTMQGTIQNTSAYDINQNITSENSEILEQFLDIPYTKNNLILNLLKENEDFREFYKGIAFSSPEALKLHGRENFQDTNFDKLSETDNLITLFSLYTYNQHPNITKNKGKIIDGDRSLTFRNGIMPSHTLSDKGRLLYLPTLLLDFKGGEINLGEKISLNQSLADLLYQQIFESELLRISQAYSQDTNIQAYDKNAKLFHILPSLNDININGVNIHDILFKTDGDLTNLKEESKEQVLNEIKKQAIEKITNYINSEVDIKMQQLEDNGFMLHDKAQFFNTKYLKEKNQGSLQNTFKYVMSEFVINNLLHNINTQQIYLGDISFYSKDKFVPTRNDGSIDTQALTDPNNKGYYANIAENIGVIIDKRAASLIAPGNALANSNSNTLGIKHFQHLALNDVESMSSTMLELIEAQYGKLSKEATKVWGKIQNNLSIIDKLNMSEKTSTTDTQIKILKEQNKKLVSTHFNEISDYFNIEGTDAQEYTTWKAHLDILYKKGDISEEQFNSLTNTLSQNKELSPEDLKVFFQPIKPVYTGLVYDAKLNIMRPVYIKSSSFPLLPQTTKNLKIDNLRKILEKIEDKNGIPAKASYQTANKIGALNSRVTMQDMYSMDPNNINEDLLSTGLSTLPMRNFKIQQETPSKERKFAKKNEDARITMGSQFFKVILGNFINHDSRGLFPNIFDEEILKLAGIENKEKLSGQDLDTIFFKVYQNYSNLLRQQLEDSLGFEDSTNFESLSINEQNNIIIELQKLLDKEISSRNYPDYLKESLQLIKEQSKIVFNTALMFDPNTYKFEALMQAIISNRLIVHTLPGNSHISGSSEGFERISSLEEIDENIKQGIVWVNGYQNELKATTIDVEYNGKESKKVIKESEVLVASHFKYYDEKTKTLKYIDLTSDEYSENIVENGKIVGRKLIEGKISQELLSSFSFRIPTSSHQSGAILKIVGFLPANQGDLLLVPKEHTVQIGEDYDVDKRQLYKSHYYVTKNGNITKFNTGLFEKDAFEDNIIKAIFGLQLNEEGIEYSENKNTTNNRIKVLENALIDIYKSVYTSPSKEIQQKIFKPLVTDISEVTANNMENYLAEEQDKSNFSILSDNYQRKLLNLGADGKSGIGVHSNAVTLEAALQRLSEENKVVLGTIQKNKYGDIIGFTPFKINIGNLGFGSILGKEQKTLDGGRDISDQHGENQNVSTDNINKQIMGKRNENSYTMSVYALMAHMGFDLSLDIVDTGITDSNGNNIKGKQHIPSLLINQPIIRDYVKLMQKYESINSKFSKNKNKEIIEILANKYGFKLPGKWVKDLDFINNTPENNNDFTGQNLWDSLKENIALKRPNQQAHVLSKFLQMQEQAKELSRTQQLLNISGSKLGVSYFETTQKIDYLNELASRHLALPGNYKNTKLIGEVSRNPEKGYTKIGQYYWKPTTIEGTMLINSLQVASNLMPINYPYDSRIINSIINNIFNVKNIDSTVKSETNLKLKYDIMLNFTSFITSQTDYFKNNIEEKRNRLLVDTVDNMSLASILKHLKSIEHPIMKNALLKDFSFNKDLVTGVHKILHTANTLDTVSMSSKYEGFSRLLKDRTVIGNFNGQNMTVQELAQDLVDYAYITKNNMAVGFKQYIPSAYLNTVGINKDFREIFNKIKNNSEELFLLKDVFIKQYFQHNPNKAIIVKDKKALNDLLQTDNIDSIPEYVSIRNTFKPKNLKQFDLYKFNSSIWDYEQINTLGEDTFDEYSPIEKEQSILKKRDNSEQSKDIHFGDVRGSYNNPYIIMKNDIGQDVNIYISSIETSLQKHDTVEKLLNWMYNNKNTSKEYVQFIEQLQKYFKTTTKVVWADNVPPGQYDSMTDTITLNKKLVTEILFKNEGSLVKTQNAIKEIILEEILHANTVRELNKHLESVNKQTGEVVVKDDAPLYVHKLVKAYTLAREAVPYNERDKSTYYSKNIYEFIAGMYVAPDYRKKLENSKKGFVKSFLKAIRDMLKSMAGITDYKSEIFSAVESLLKEQPTNNRGISLNKPSNIKSKLEKIRDDSVEIKENKNIIHINKEDIDRFNSYLNKSNNVLPKTFFTEITNKISGFGQSVIWIKNENNLYDLIEQETGEIIEDNINLSTGQKEIPNNNLDSRYNDDIMSLPVLKTCK